MPHASLSRELVRWMPSEKGKGQSGSPYCTPFVHIIGQLLVRRCPPRQSENSTHVDPDDGEFRPHTVQDYGALDSVEGLPHVDLQDAGVLVGHARVVSAAHCQGDVCFCCFCGFFRTEAELCWGVKTLASFWVVLTFGLFGPFSDHLTFWEIECKIKQNDAREGKTYANGCQKSPKVGKDLHKQPLPRKHLFRLKTCQNRRFYIYIHPKAQRFAFPSGLSTFTGKSDGAI